MSGLKQLIREIHSRSLWQVLAIYAGASWAVFQVTQTLTEGLGLPDFVPRYAFVLLLFGLPIVVATALVQKGLQPARRRDPTLLYWARTSAKLQAKIPGEFELRPLVHSK